MMDMLSLIRSKRAGAYIGMGVFVMTIVSLVVYLVYATSLEGLIMPWVIVLLLLTAAAEAVQFFFDNNYTPIAAAGCSMAALGCFAAAPPATIGSIVDHFQNIVMFGNPEKFGIIIAVIVLLLVTSVAAIVGCFFPRVAAPASGKTEISDAE